MKRFRFFLNKFFLINLLLAVVFIMVFFWISLSALESYTKHGESITVPDLKDLTLEQAGQLLKNKQLQYQVMDSAYVLGKLPMTILEQVPKPLSKVKQNRTIYLTVNATNPPTVKMPNLIDVSLRQAVLILENYGLKIGELIYKPDLAQNAVLEQQFNEMPISPGTDIPKGTVIDLVLGNGLGNTLVPVPDLAGLTLSEAKFVLQGSSLNLGATVFEASVIDSGAAVVYKQIPPSSGNTRLNMGEAIDVFLAEGTMQKKADSTQTQGE